MIRPFKRPTDLFRAGLHPAPQQEQRPFVWPANPWVREPKPPIWRPKPTPKD